jgi:hypothetical protein
MTWFHGTATEYQPGDLVKPEYELGAKRGQGRVYATTRASTARDYGRHKADALRAGYGIDVPGRAYQVEPTGPIEPDPTVAAEFCAWRSRAPFVVVADVTTPEPQQEAEAG